MPQVMLDGAGVVSVVSELKPAGVPEHMWVNRKGDTRLERKSGECLPETAGRHRATTLSNEQIGRGVRISL